MEVIKGKGLTAISTVFMAIAWFNQPLSEYSFQGFPFREIPEWKLIVPLILAWILFLFRYLQGLGGMLETVKIEFLKQLKRKAGKLSYDGSTGKPHRIEMEVNLNYVMTDKWTYAYFDSGHVGKTHIKNFHFEDVDPDYMKKWNSFI